MKLIVTDLTRFKDPTIVCLAGINPETGECIRPMINRNGKASYLSFASVKERKVIPGSCIEGDFTKTANAHAPHVEDYETTGQITLTEPATGAAFKNVLEMSSHTSMLGAFGQLPVDRLFSPINPPPVSIVTLKLESPKTQFRLIIDTGFGARKFKAHITDGKGFQMTYMPVTDLGYSDHISKIQEQDPLLSELNGFLQAQECLYLRVGLGRRYAANPERDGFWVQLNGIYSFPSQRKDLRIYD